MRRMLLRRTVFLLASAAALAVVPGASADPAQVVLRCTALGGLPGGPPDRVGTITVSKDGEVRVALEVPGPCGAPGFPANR
jgi:hypothetical protein